MNSLTLHADRITDASGAAWAAMWGGNLHSELPRAGNFVDAPRWVVWSGTPAEGLFDESPFIWGLPAWTAFEEGLRRVAETAGEVGGAGERKVLVRPHARHVMSDLPSCLRVLERTNVANARVLLDPAAMLTEDMRKNAEDHVTRILEGIGTHPGVEAIVVGDDAALAAACGRLCPGVPLVR